MSLETPYYALALEKLIIDFQSLKRRTTRTQIKDFIESKGYQVKDIYMNVAIDNLVKNRKAVWVDVYKRFLSLNIGGFAIRDIGRQVNYRVTNTEHRISERAQ